MSKVSNDKKNSQNKLSSIDILMVAFGAMIGWGWVISSGGWIQTSGVIGTILGFIIAGIMIYFVGLVYAELTTTMPLNGGGLLFSYKAFGRGVSYICSWAMVLGYIGVVCYEACSLPTVISYIYPKFMKGYLYTIVGFDVYASWLIVAIMVSVLISFINIRGVRTAAKLQNFLTIIIAFVGLILIVSSALYGDSTNLENQVIKGISKREEIKNILAIAIVAPFFLFGFDVIPQATEEINVELRKIGKILVLSIILAVSFYSLIVFAIGYAMNKNEIANSISGNGLVAADAIRKLYSSEIMSKVLILGGICGIVTSWNSFLIGGTRVLQSMSEARMIPRVFKKKHSKYNTPVNAIYLIGGLSILAPFFGKEMLNWIANASSLASCLSYGIVSLSYLVMRGRYPELKRPFCVKRWKIVGATATVMSFLMVVIHINPKLNSSICVEEIMIVLMWSLLGIIFYIFQIKLNKR